MSHSADPITAQRRLARTKWLFCFLFLTLLGALDGVHNFWALRGDGTGITVEREIRASITWWLPYYALVPAAMMLVERFRLDFERARTYVIHGLAGLIFSYAHILCSAIGPLPDGRALSYWGRFFWRLQDEFAIDYLFYSVIVASAYMLRHYEHLKEGELRASLLETTLAQTHLNAIQSQLNPHFLFNTLQAISMLAQAGERDDVVDMLARLSGLLRISFDKHRPQQITLASEVKFIDSYLAIHQLSLGPRLRIKFQVMPETLSASVTAMLLQPLVENAIAHGIAIKPGQGIIRVGARRDRHWLILEVADSGPGFGAAGPSASGIGLSTTQSRLALMYGEHHAIEYGCAAEGGARITISIPFTPASVSALPMLPEAAGA